MKNILFYSSNNISFSIFIIINDIKKVNVKYRINRSSKHKIFVCPNKFRGIFYFCNESLKLKLTYFYTYYMYGEKLLFVQ